MPHIITSIAKGLRFSVSRIVHLFLTTDTEGIESFLGIPTILTAMRLFQAAGHIPLWVPNIPFVASGLRLLVQSNDFWNGSIPTQPVAILLCLNALWLWAALVSNVWWARFTAVTINVGVWFFFSALLWLHLGPGGAVNYIGPLVASAWVSRRLILDLHKKRQNAAVTDQATRLAGEIVGVILSKYPGKTPIPDQA